MPAPRLAMVAVNKSTREGGKSQSLMLFMRGNAISGAPIIRGSNQFPNPPIITGITTKKIIIKAWAVTKELYNWSSSSQEPGVDSSIRTRRLREVPIIADLPPRIK